MQTNSGQPTQKRLLSNLEAQAKRQEAQKRLNKLASGEPLRERWRAPHMRMTSVSWLRPVVVELISPHLMLEYFTVAFGEFFWTSAGFPDVPLHVPRASPRWVPFTG